jgi:uncharacterized protein (TIGR00661 family)
MKILYAIQGTGNGHLCRAKDIYPELQKYGEVDLLVSGYQSDIPLPFPVKYRLKGLSFIFGKHGGVSLIQTAKRLNLFQFIRDVYRLPVEDYDLIVNDFEPISAWACKFNGHSCIALSHQSAVVHKSAPKPKKDGWFGRGILKYYAPFSLHYGFHFKRYDSNVFLPVIRKEVQALESIAGNHYTVYLPAYNAESLVRFLSKVPKVKWQVFCKHSKEAFQFENISVSPISNDAFLKSLSGCKGALLGAGFEGPAEALYLKKKLMVVPMARQVEQQCNAAALEQLDVPVIPSLQSRYVEKVNEWILNDDSVTIAFSKETAAIAVGQLIHDFLEGMEKRLTRPLPDFY